MVGVPAVPGRCCLRFRHHQTATLRRFYLLFFIDIPTRNVLLHHGQQLADAKAHVRDRGSQLIDAFDEIFRTKGHKILKTPIRTPVANAFAERWIGTLRRELLDRTLI